MDKPKRGRPRPQETIDRDNKILGLLHEHGKCTRYMLVDQTGLPQSQVYLSLSRLRRKGLVDFVGGYKTEKYWSASAEATDDWVPAWESVRESVMDVASALSAEDQ